LELAEAKGRLRREKDAGPSALDDLPEDLLGESVRVDVRRIEKIDSRFECDVDKSAGFLDPGGTPCLEERRSARDTALAKALERGPVSPSDGTLSHSWQRSSRQGGSV
jgi:hypothetical protein